jgi:hypothetical protein
LGAQVSQLKKLVETLGTAADTRGLRSRLKALRDSIQTAARGNSAAVKQLSSAAAAGVLTIEVKVRTHSLPTGNTVRNFPTHGQLSAAQGSPTTVSPSDTRSI